MKLPTVEIAAELVRIGVFPEDAEAAAADPRLEWSDATLDGCIAWVGGYRGDVPGGTMLWSKFLRVGWFPPMALPDDGPTICPVCAGDLAICHGVLHGYVKTLACWSCGKPLQECHGLHASAQEEEAA